MPLSFRKFTSTGAATYPIGFSYISPDHVQVLVDGVLRSGNYTLANGDITFTSPIPASGVELRIYRNTPGRTDATKNSVIVDFVNGATLSESDLDASVKQNFYLVQEAQDTAEGAVLSQQSVTEPMMANNAASERVIQTDAVTTNKIANLAVTNAKLAANSVSEVKIVDLSVSTRTVQNQAITEEKVDNTFLGTIVRTSGDQSVGGTKTFGNLPVIPETPTVDAHAASKRYVDDGDRGYVGTDEGNLNYRIGTVLACETRFPTNYGISSGSGSTQIHDNFWASPLGANLSAGTEIGAKGWEAFGGSTVASSAYGFSPLRANTRVDVYWHPQNARLHWTTGVVTPPPAREREMNIIPQFVVCPLNYVPWYSLTWTFGSITYVFMNGTMVGAANIPADPGAAALGLQNPSSTKLSGVWASRGCIVPVSGDGRVATVFVQRIS